MSKAVDSFTGAKARKRAKWDMAEAQEDIKKQKQVEEQRLAEADDDIAKRKYAKGNYGRKSLISSDKGGAKNTKLGES
mgnify:CR=1 FL=1